MSNPTEIIIIIGGGQPPRVGQANPELAARIEETRIQLQVEGDGSVSDLLRQAADVLDGIQTE